MTKKSNHTKFTVLIAAAGSGARSGMEIPKQYCEIGGEMILRRTVKKFLDHPDLKSIHVIIDPSHAKWYQKAVMGLNIEHFIEGAEDRKSSVFNGLKKIPNVMPDDIILIHDAARPFVEQNDIDQLLYAMKDNDAATLGVAISDSLCRLEASEEIIDKYVSREQIYSIKTPQAFIYKDILEAHERFKGDASFTDDAGLVRAMGKNVALVRGSRKNFKITTPEDFELAEKQLESTPSYRSGLGYDVHAFDEVQAESIRLGGLDIPHNRSLKGHSDADVVLHAVTDALLGAIGAGDIGDYFPPSDPQWKGKDSAFFLEEVVKKLQEKSAVIVNIDTTIICEAPKIGPYKKTMQNRIAEILQTLPEQVNIKATTSEKLGFTGREEGIAAQALASIKIYA